LLPAEFFLNTPHRNLVFVRPLWLGFAIAPPVTAFVFLAINLLLEVFGLREYSGPPDEAYYGTDPAMLAINFVILSIVSCLTALSWGLPLIYILKRLRRLSLQSFFLGATILGAIILPIEVAVSVVIFEGTVTDWNNVLAWAFAIGAASGGFTALVFRVVVGVKNGGSLELPV
jgi:hypothetical protein